MRRLIFQIHLWTGVVLALYLIMIGVTGSVLVFRDELLRAARPWPWKATGTGASVTTVIHKVQDRYPGWRLTALQAPASGEPGYTATLQSRSRLRVGVDAASGSILGELPAPPVWLRIVTDLHETLLLGRKGRVVNGVAGAFLLLMCVSGLVIWWRRRPLILDFRRGWRRINFDLHGAIGFWAVLLIAFWGFSAIYFAWSAQVFALVKAISPIVNSTPPGITVLPQGSEADVSAMVRQAKSLDRGAAWKGIRFPYGPRAPLQVVMGRPGGSGSDYEDILFFDPYTGRYLQTWRYGVSETLGDWIIWLQSPLHMGTAWGLGFKIVWAMAGLALPLLAVTGLIMYWNRSLRRMFRPPAKRDAPTRRAVVQSFPAILLVAAAHRAYSVGSTATGVPFSFVDLKSNQPSADVAEDRHHFGQNAEDRGS